MLYSVITTIQPPTDCVRQLVGRLSEIDGRLIVAGDSKGPEHFESQDAANWPVEFLSLEDQNSGGYQIAQDLPTGHYARKNIAYLHAIRNGAECIYETDDDNAPLDGWRERSEHIDDLELVEASSSRWINVYRYFSDELIWPRGLPLTRIRDEVPSPVPSKAGLRAPVQQGLVNNAPDVDAIWRLAMDRPFDFDNKPGIYLGPGNWCPFNTQSTWWWPLAYPLLYIPSYCSFRMCDIWKSFIAQRCLWAMDLGIAFHAPEVYQDRNVHDLQRDFDDEVPGYTQNHTICDSLMELDLPSGEGDVAANLLTCYEKLVETGVFPAKELKLVEAWVGDLSQ